MRTHKTKTTTVLLALLLLGAGLLRAPDTLTVDQCRQLAEQASPLQQKKALSESILAFQQQNLQATNLPRIAVNGQATWQSEVFGIPIESPLFQIPVIPKDQYRLSADVSEKIWDGRLSKVQEQQRMLERDIALAQTDVDVFQLRELVTDLYFKALLLQESESVLLASKTDLESRLKQVEGAIKEGVALRTTADQVRIQILKTDQQTDAVRADKKTLLDLLALWTGRSTDNVVLVVPPPPSPMAAAGPANRPEYKLFALQQNNVKIGQDLLDLRKQPRLDAFLQGGFGSPNPFNAFETGFEPFLMIGLRANWTPIDWGNTKRDKQVLAIQAQNIDIQKQAFDQRLQASVLKDNADAMKWTAQLRQDDQIITLQQDIVTRADAQVKNGVMTGTDYLTQLNLLTQAQLTRKTHEIQAAQARAMAAVKRG